MTTAAANLDITIASLSAAITRARDGESMRSIAASFGISDSHLSDLGLVPVYLDHPEMRARPCICCRRPFVSANFGNRMCGPCLRGEVTGSGIQ